MSRNNRRRMLTLVMCIPPVLLIVMLGDSLYQVGNSGNASNVNADNTVIMEDSVEGIGKMPQGILPVEKAQKNIAMPVEKNQKNIPQTVQEKNEEKRSYDVCFIKAAYAEDPEDIEWPPDVWMKEEHKSRVNFYLYTNHYQSAKENTLGWEVIKRGFLYERWTTHHAWPRLMAWKEPRIFHKCRVAIFVSGIHKLPKSDKMDEFLSFAAKLHSKDSVGWAMDPTTDDKASLANQLDPASEFNQLRQSEIAGGDETNIQKLFDATSEWLTNQDDFSPSDCTIYDESMIAYSLECTNYIRLSQFFWNEYREERLIDIEGPLWCYAVQHWHETPASLSPIRDLFHNV